MACRFYNLPHIDAGGYTGRKYTAGYGDHSHSLPIVEKAAGHHTTEKEDENEETEFKEIDGHSNLSSGSSGGKLVFLPGIRLQMRTGTASGKCFMRGYRRTMVGVGTGFYCVADP